MSEEDEAREWAEYAEEDLIMAKSALRRSGPLTNGSGRGKGPRPLDSSIFPP